VDGNTAWYFVDARKTPLSLLELRQRQLDVLAGKPAAPLELVKIALTPHEWKGLKAWPPFLELRLIPRSNFLEEKSPLPLNQGMRGWFWTGHCVWTDRASPASLLYSHRIVRQGDWDWTLNQAQIWLEATEMPGLLLVHVDTETPSFDTFLAKRDGGSSQPVSSGFPWKLHKGKNTLEIRPRNQLGREGIASRVALMYPQ
jgi:hypothetical protein